jgi:hypothetical protein
MDKRVRRKDIRAAEVERCVIDRGEQQCAVERRAESRDEQAVVRTCEGAGEGGGCVPTHAIGHQKLARSRLGVLPEHIAPVLHHAHERCAARR